MFNRSFWLAVLSFGLGIAAWSSPAAAQPAKPSVKFVIPDEVPGKKMPNVATHVTVEVAHVRVTGRSVLMSAEGPPINATCPRTEPRCTGSCKLTPASELNVYLKPDQGTKIAPGSYRLRYRMGANPGKSDLSFKWSLKGSAQSNTPPSCVFEAKSNSKEADAGTCELVVSSPDGTPLTVYATTKTLQVFPWSVEIIKE